MRGPRFIFAGIDPGKSGAIAWTDSLGLELTVGGMPKTERGILDILGRLAGHLTLDEDDPAQICRFCLLEHAQSFPGDGHVGAFSYGRNYGSLRSNLGFLEIPWDTIRPRDWQKEFGPIRNKKHESRPAFKRRLLEQACRLFPKTKISLYAADAVLLAELCRRRYAQVSRPEKSFQEVLS